MSLPSRDRIAILSALGVLTLLSWLWLVRMAVDMDAGEGMADMGMGAGHAGPGAPAGPGASVLGVRPWSAADFAMMFSMWAVMMVGMMGPTAAPVTLVYAMVARKAARAGTPVAPTAAFVLGYVAMWTLFSVAATVAQWGLDQAALLSPMMVTTSPLVGALLLGAAGAYQLTPFKDRCLEHCRSPAHFISRHWRAGSAGAFRMGFEHGAFCLGCCWALMGLLFFGGVMSLAWIAAITAFVLAEKVLPFGDRGGRIAGVAMIVVAGWFLARDLA